MGTCALAYKSGSSVDNPKKKHIATHVFSSRGFWDLPRGLKSVFKFVRPVNNKSPETRLNVEFSS